MQQIMIDVPDSIVILTKEEHSKLLDKIDDRLWISFQDLSDWTGLKRDKLDTILKRYRDELDVMNGGPAKYPDGGKWSFEKEGIRKWFKENHARIWAEDER